MASPSELLASMPGCALECFTSAVAKSACDATDVACTCSDQALNAAATACIAASCAVKDQLSSANITYTACGVEPNVDHSYVPALLTCLIAAAFVVALRLLGRVFVGGKLWWDDWFNFAAMVFCVAYTALALSLKSGGFGTDMWAVPLENITGQLRGYYTMTVMYIIARLLIRISIILFYLRIFQVDRARRLMLGTLAGSIIVSLPLIFGAAFMCSPVSYFWTRWDGEHAGYCVDAKPFLWAGWMILLVNDFWIMGIPLPFVAKLQLSLRRKIMVSVMFCTGLLVVAVSIYKLTLIDEFIGKTNPTHDEVSMGIWVGVEIDIGVICACMPSMPLVFRPLWKRIKDSTRGTSDGSGYPRRASRYAEFSRGSASSGAGEKKRRLSPWSSTTPSGSVSEGSGVVAPATAAAAAGGPQDIRLVTAIHQTSNGSSWDAETAGSFTESLTELRSPREGTVKTQAWSGDQKYVGSMV